MRYEAYYLGRFGYDTREPMTNDCRDSMFIESFFPSWFKFGYAKRDGWHEHLNSHMLKMGCV